MTPQDFRQHLALNTADHETLIREYTALWDLTSKLSQQVTHLQEGGTITVNQKRSYQSALQDFVSDLRKTGTVSAESLLRHIEAVKTVL